MARTAKKTVAKKAAAPKRPPRRSGAAQGGAAGAAAGAASAAVTPTGSYRAKVRMYRQGLGDCFLISLPRTDGGTRPFYVMIDCGVVLGTPNPAAIMKQVLDSIVQETGGAIDLLIATHEHWDHLSGFVQAKDIVRQADEGRTGLARLDRGPDRRIDQEAEGGKRPGARGAAHGLEPDAGGRGFR